MEYINASTIARATNYDQSSIVIFYPVVVILVVVVAYKFTVAFIEKDRGVVVSNGKNNTRGLIGRPAILGIGTANPPYKLHKTKCDGFLEDHLKKGTLGTDQVDFVKRIRDSCGIEHRYSGFDPDTHAGDADRLFGTTLDEPVGKRNEYWETFVKSTSIEASRKAVGSWGGDATKITHVVFHSCTGFKAPGIELDVIDALGLTGVKRRVGINFMGCHAGFTALDVAKSFCLSDPGSITLVICAEACVAHMSSSKNRSELMGSVIFADGAAACLVGPGQYGDWALGKAMTKTLPPNTRDLMTMSPDNKCYRIYLSKKIKNHFGAVFLLTMRNLVQKVLGHHVSAGSAEWCVHPGGKGILDGLSKGLGAEKLRHSYAVLRNYGNMSSPTIFFVMKKMIDEAKEIPSKQDAICLGFGPGLTCELCALHKIR